ncbi:MAG: VCBS repeat-containing protein [Actinobacteria bacterium]|nr:VCBS repeat-containing protein [Actinomycetota bacterium]
MVEETGVSGIDHVYDGDFRFFVGGGVAVFDCDDDGRQDVYLAGGANPAALYRNVSPVGGALRFTAVPGSATDLTGVTGSYPLDVDGDGRLDLVVLRVGENVLLRGLGGCRFERANEAWSFDGGGAWTVGFSATWEEGADLPTLAFGNYLTLDTTGTPTGACDDNHVLRPDGPGGYGEPIPLTPGWCSLSMLFSDWGHTGQVDLRVANDRHYTRDGEEQLWRFAAGEPPYPYTHEEGWRSLRIWGMGIAAHDVTGDGIPEVVITSQGDNKLQTLEDGATGPSYTDIAIRRGATAHRPFVGDQTLPSTAWHPEFGDVNNDGLVDLFISKGNVDAMVEYAARDPSDLLIGRADGTFFEGALEAGVVSLGRDRGAALADFNLDGLPDLIEVSRRENVRVWRNVGAGDADSPVAMGNWVAVRLEQQGPNRDAVGAWIEVDTGGETTQVWEMTVGGGHAGGQLGWLHVGLGERDGAQIRVQWPDGTIGPWQHVDAHTFVIVAPDTDAQVWRPEDAGATG